MHALVEQNTRLMSAQSTPLLLIDTGNIDGGKPVSNVGTGPAQIAWFRVSDDQGNDYSNGALYERVAKLDSRLPFTSEQISATLMRSGAERSVFKWPKPVDSKPALAEWEKLNSTRFHLHASACYCSIFEECRITEFGENRPKPVPSCEAASSR